MASTIQTVVSINSQTDIRSLKWIYRAEPLLAMVLLVVVTPVMIVLAVVIAILARRSPLVRHKRVGFLGRDLHMLKFRTMWEQDSAWRPLWPIENVMDSPVDLKLERDPRVTSNFAALCRRLSIDELPQIYHVARGQMSFVGPRPITRAEIETHYQGSAALLVSVRPGLTGLWQSMGRSRLTYVQRRRLDEWFVRRVSPGLYFRILARTMPRVLWGADAF